MNLIFFFILLAINAFASNSSEDIIILNSYPTIKITPPNSDPSSESSGGIGPNPYPSLNNLSTPQQNIFRLPVMSANENNNLLNVRRDIFHSTETIFNGGSCVSSQLIEEGKQVSENLEGAASGETNILNVAFVQSLVGEMQDFRDRMDNLNSRVNNLEEMSDLSESARENQETVQNGRENLVVTANFTNTPQGATLEPVQISSSSQNINNPVQISSSSQNINNPVQISSSSQNINNIDFDNRLNRIEVLLNKIYTKNKTVIANFSRQLTGLNNSLNCLQAEEKVNKSTQKNNFVSAKNKFNKKIW